MHSAHHRHRMSQARLTLFMFKVHFRRNWYSNLGIKFLWSLVRSSILKGFTLLWNLWKRPSKFPLFPTIAPPLHYGTFLGDMPRGPTFGASTEEGACSPPYCRRKTTFTSLGSNFGAMADGHHDGLFVGTKRGPGEMDLPKRPQRCWADMLCKGGRTVWCLSMLTGCWLVEPPLWKIWVRQLGLYNIPNIWKNKTCSKTTNQFRLCLTGIFGSWKMRNDPCMGDVLAFLYIWILENIQFPWCFVEKMSQ